MVLIKAEISINLQIVIRLKDDTGQCGSNDKKVPLDLNKVPGLKSHLRQFFLI